MIHATPDPGFIFPASLLAHHIAVHTSMQAMIQVELGTDRWAMREFVIVQGDFGRI
jgi:hypothetical protein